MSGYLDAHQHLWTLAEHPQTWMDPATAAVIGRDFEATDLLAVARPAGVTSSIVVQTVNDADETAHLLARSHAEPFIAGVVGWADLTAPDLDEQLASWRAGIGGDRLVGLRHLVQSEPDPNWLDRPAVRRGLSLVADAGLAFDLLVTSTHLASAVRTVRALPSTRFVVDHLAKPPLSQGDLLAWSTGLAALAAEPNVVAKLSGLVTEADWLSWTSADLAPAVDVALETFGSDRLLFGTDWPVCLLASSYAQVVTTTEQLLSSLSRHEHEKIFRSNARTFYGLV